MLSPGNTYTLKVVKLTPQGAYLDAENLGEILLPSKYCPTDLQQEEFVQVFIYFDSNSLLIATTQQPKVEVGQFAYLPVLANSDFGTFLDWGLDKDLLAPFGEQHRPMESGKSYLVHVYLNNADGRITASSKIEKFLREETPHQFTAGQSVDLIIANSTDLGYKAIINHSHWGLVYKNEVSEPLSFGQTRKGVVKYVRPDGKIDLALTQTQVARDKHAAAILEYLNANNGFADVHDKTAPEKIQQLLGMSKKSFKKAIGGLYKQRVITISTDGIRLTD